MSIPRNAQPAPTILRSGLIFGVGLGAGLEVNLLLRIIPTALHVQLPNINPEYIASSILLVSALMALPLEQFMFIASLKGAMAKSLGVIVALMGLNLLVSNTFLAVGLIFTFGAALGLLFITQIPFALAMVPPAHAGLGTGLYFGGMGAATAILSVLNQSSDVTSITGFLGGAIAFLLATSCLAAIRYA